MTLDDLPRVELDALKLLLSGDDPACDTLRSQLQHVSQVERRETGAGVYVDFILDGVVKPVQNDKTFQLSGVFAVSKKSVEIGFLLFVVDGLIECLEAYVYDDVYPRYADCDFKLKKEGSTNG